MLEKVFVRNFEAEEYLEAFLTSAVSSVLILRFYLFLTGFPRIGLGAFHIAHLLWGGLLMLVAQVLLLTFLTRTSKMTAAIVGGIGFGAFIDELGKFITSDNNYFYQPTVAIIYVLFVLLYLSVQSIDRLRSTSDMEYLANSLELVKEAAVNDLDKNEWARALAYLNKLRHNNPIASTLTGLLNQVELIPPSPPNLLSRLKVLSGNFYRLLVRQKWFVGLVILLFVTKSLLSLYNISRLTSSVSELVLAIGIGIFVLIGIYEISFAKVSVIRVLVYIVLLLGLLLLSDRLPGEISLPRLPLAVWGQLLSSALAGIIVVAGILRMYKSRLVAYRTFKLSLLVSIFLTQFFAFYQTQFYALIGLLANLFVYGVIKYVISQELLMHKVDEGNIMPT